MGPPGACWGFLVAFWGLLEPPGSLLGASWEPPGASWGLLGVFVGWFLAGPWECLVVSWGDIVGPCGVQRLSGRCSGAPWGARGFLSSFWSPLASLSFQPSIFECLTAAPERISARFLAPGSLARRTRPRLSSGPACRTSPRLRRPGRTRPPSPPSPPAEPSGPAPPAPAWLAPPRLVPPTPRGRTCKPKWS